MPRLNSNKFNELPENLVQKEEDTVGLNTEPNSINEGGARHFDEDGLRRLGDRLRRDREEELLQYKVILKRDFDDAVENDDLPGFFAKHPEVARIALQQTEAEQEQSSEDLLEHPKGPRWAERTSGREVTPVDWIKKHYGRWIDGTWDPDGLSQADLTADRPLYDAYVARIRRLPDEDLGLPVTPKPRISDVQKHLEERRFKRREVYRITGR